MKVHLFLHKSTYQAFRYWQGEGYRQEESAPDSACMFLRMHTLSRVILTSTVISALTFGTLAPAIGSPTKKTSQSAEQPASLSLPLADEPQTWVGAHRGQWRDHPENSVPGILQAVDDGAEVIEIDIKKTKDGHMVLNHDDTVNRTTNGRGRVEDLTLAQVKGLRLRQGQGNGPSPLTDLHVPTFSEILEATRGQNILLNLDKGWEYRDQLIAELDAAGMLDYGLFKGAPNAEEANEFMAANPRAQYMHIIDDDQVDDFAEFTTNMPDAIEVAFDTLEDTQAQPEYLAAIDARTDLWLNSMWDSVGGGYTDEASLRDPNLGWQAMVDLGADVIQTDNVRMIDAWRDGRDVTTAGMKPSSIRAQAEDFLDDPAHYADTNDHNDCASGKAIRNPQSPVDACDLDGSHVVQYIQDGEHFTLEVEVDRPGMYALSLRHSGDKEPGGTVTVDTETGHSTPVALPNTTHNRAFTVTDLGKYKFDKGTNRIKLSFTHPDYMSIDWLQLDRGQRADRDLMNMRIAER